MTKVFGSTQRHPVRSALLWLAAILIATEAISALSECLTSGAADRLPPAVVAVFSGKFEHGAPVYRLPPVTISAGRGAAALEAQAPKRDSKEARAIRSHTARSSS